MFDRCRLSIENGFYPEAIFFMGYVANMSWKKVSSAVDLSYVTEQMGEITPFVQP